MFRPVNRWRRLPSIMVSTPTILGKSLTCCRGTISVQRPLSGVDGECGTRTLFARWPMLAILSVSMTDEFGDSYEFMTGAELIRRGPQFFQRVSN